MCGIPGSGKDYYINKNLAHLPMVSMDNVRREHKLDRNNKHDKGRVIQMVKEQAKKLLAKHQDFVWNATNITKSNRDNLISMMLPYKPKVHIIYVEKPYQQLLHDNLDREHPVRPQAIEEYVGKLQVPDLTEAHTVTYHISDPN
jgi:predicted kinase